MNISIIGAGNIGATLARKLSETGHSVRLANSRGPDTIKQIARDAGAVAVEREEAVRDADVIIISVPFDKLPTLTAVLKNAADDTIIIDTSNYYPFRDGDITDISNGKPEGVWSSEVLNRPVVKAWNALLAVTLAEKSHPAGSPERIAIPISGDDTHAKSVVTQLIDETGFDVVNAGSLSESWRHQPGTPAYCTELTASALQDALKAADKSRAPRNRDALMNEFMSAGGSLTHDHIVERNRAVTAC